MSHDFRLIPLTQGQFAKVSLHRYELIIQYRWLAIWNDVMQSYYARSVVLPEFGKSVAMHRMVLGLIEWDGRTVVDHINHDTLDNRDDNLRICNHSQNQCNRGAQINNRSGYKGVAFHKNTGRWAASISIGNHRRYLGYYQTPEEAHGAYCEAAKILHGEFAQFSRQQGEGGEDSSA